MNVKEAKSIHLIGVGGINMSAVAKLLLAAGVKVSGSDLNANDQTEYLSQHGAAIYIGEAAEHIPVECDFVIYTSAAPVTNLERVAAAQRGIPQLTNFAFLGQWFSDAKTLVVTGTHGKSTTTAMLGLMFERAGLDPTVVVGSKIPSFPDGNIRLGRRDLFIIEGDEYARHFLEFHPDGVILNNLELDHVDVFRTVEMLIRSFHELVGQVKDGGVIVANVGDERIAALIETEREALETRGISIVPFGTDETIPVISKQEGDFRRVSIGKTGEELYGLKLSLPGHFNAMNAAAASLLARAWNIEEPVIRETLELFKGIWRRFEFLGEYKEARVYSDYAHHPTAVTSTLKAAREAFLDRRILLSFQPHHRNRTKELFFDFVSSLDGADVAIICEIYDVAGREEAADQSVSSSDLVDAVLRHDTDFERKRTVEYAADPVAAVRRILELSQPDDIVLVMGAGDIDAAIRKMMV